MALTVEQKEALGIMSCVVCDGLVPKASEAKPGDRVCFTHLLTDQVAAKKIVNLISHPTEPLAPVGEAPPVV